MWERIGLVFVILYTLIRHSFYGFDQQSSGWVMTPFFRDHTSYGATIAMIIFPILGYVYYYSGQRKGILLLGLFILVFGLILSKTEI